LKPPPGVLSGLPVREGGCCTEEGHVQGILSLEIPTAASWFDGLEFGFAGASFSPQKRAVRLRLSALQLAMRSQRHSLRSKLRVCVHASTCTTTPFLRALRILSVCATGLALWHVPMSLMTPLPDGCVACPGMSAVQHLARAGHLRNCLQCSPHT